MFALYPHVFTEWIERYGSKFKEGAVITDVTGVKGEIVEKIQSMLPEGVEFIAAHPMAGRESSGVENECSYTHTSIAIADALKAVQIPAAEVHISDISARESFRAVSYVRDVCVCSIVGHGTSGYTEAIDKLAEIACKML